MSARQAKAWVVFFAVLVLLAYGVIKPSPERTATGGARSASGASGGLGHSGSAAAGHSRRAVVLRVVDGDTIIVRILAATGRPTRRTERVRYIGVDTPESVKPNSPVECYGKRAAAFNRTLVDGRRVRLVPDHELLDRYGRTLAYVYTDAEFVNAELVRRGYARTLEIAPNTSKAGYLAKLERVAIRTNRGLWGSCDR